jgi:hypothetical protein
VGGLRLTNVRLSLETRNLLSWFSSRYTGLDSEVSFQGNTNVGRSQEITPYPPARSYFLALDLGL